MQISDFLMLLGGLSLFLYGMHMMSNGLEQSAGDKLQSILEKLTKNKFLAILVGAGITAAIQSSSATTVMTIGFVNSGLMKLNKAVWIIMGANIGTTITGQLIALDISAIAPVFAIIGVVMVTFLKNKKLNHLGEVIAGLGILFIGMNFMGDSMVPLQSNEGFVNLMTTFSNPLLGILAGAAFTAIIQSSSASIGILQTLASQGLISLQSSSFVLFGQNMGTCITAFLASLSGNRNAKRTALIHLMFNAFGTLIFLGICIATPLTEWIASFTPNSPMTQIANVHTVFNITTTLLLLPFGEKLAELTLTLLPLKDNEKEESSAAFVASINIGTSMLAVSQLQKDVRKMIKTTKESFRSISYTLIEGAKVDKELIEKNEARINRINFSISEFMMKISKLDLEETDQQKCNMYFKLALDVERIGDHIVNLLEYGQMLNKKEINFDASIKEELTAIMKAIDDTYQILETDDLYIENDKFQRIEVLEQRVDDMNRTYRENQIQRLKNELADPKTTVMYADLLTNLERISDHMLNIAQVAHSMEMSLQSKKKAVKVA